MTTWKLLPLALNQEVQVAFRQWNDGRQESCLVTTETFKKEVLAGAELQDADGNVMTDSAEYVRTLP